MAFIAPFASIAAVDVAVVAVAVVAAAVFTVARMEGRSVSGIANGERPVPWERRELGVEWLRGSGNSTSHARLRQDGGSMGHHSENRDQ
jgi:hypothetical protein